MGNFANVVVTDAGLQLINEAIAGSGQVLIASAEVGSGYPAGTQDPQDFTSLVQLVMAATMTSANDQVLYQTTVRITVSSEYAPYQFQLNEIGIYAQIGTNAPVLFAYASSPGQGDYVTPAGGSTPIMYDYAILIQYEQDSPVVATVTVTPQVQLHAATHRGDGIDPIGLADSTASGLLSSPPGSANQVLLGTVPQSWGPIPKHAPTHLDNGVDPISVATTSRTGLLPKLSGNQTDTFCGDGSWQSRLVPTGVIWEFAGSNPPIGWLICDGSAVSRTTYATLFAVIGTMYGAGDGLATFNLPDVRGRVTLGAGTGSGLTNRAVGTNGGEENHLLAAGELATHTHQTQESPHNHTLTEHPHTHLVELGAYNITNPPAGVDAYVAGPFTGLVNQIHRDAMSDPQVTGISIAAVKTGLSILPNSGGDNGHNNMQPFLCVNKIIKT